MNTYFSILQTISHGRTRPGQITVFTGIISRSIYPYPENLIRSGSVERQAPLFGLVAKKIHAKVKMQDTWSLTLRIFDGWGRVS